METKLTGVLVAPRACLAGRVEKSLRLSSKASLWLGARWKWARKSAPRILFFTSAITKSKVKSDLPIVIVLVVVP